MAADAPDLKGIFVPLDPDDLAMLKLASDGQEPVDFLRQSALSVARGIVGKLDPDGAPEGVRETQEAGDPVLPVATLDPETSALLERVARVEDLLRELVVVQTTVLSEIYAHTAFRDAAHAKECRDRAEAKIAKVAPSIMRLLFPDRPIPQLT